MVTSKYVGYETGQLDHASFVEFSIEAMERRLETNDLRQRAKDLADETATYYERILFVDGENTETPYDARIAVPDVRYIDETHHFIGEAKPSLKEIRNPRFAKQVNAGLNELLESDRPDRKFFISVPYSYEPDTKQELEQILLAFEGTEAKDFIIIVSEIDGKILLPPENFDKRINQPMMDDYVTYRGKTYHIKRGMLPIKSILYDERNFRLRSTRRESFTQEECFQMLIGEAALKKDSSNLRQEILTEKCITEPFMIYVDENNNYVAHEGNTRKGNIQDIQARAKEASGYDYVPVIIFLDATYEECEAIKNDIQHQTKVSHGREQDAIACWWKHKEGKTDKEIHDFFNGRYDETIIRSSYETVDFLVELNCSDNQIKRIYDAAWMLLTKSRNWNQKVLTKKDNGTNLMPFTKETAIKRLLLELQSATDKGTYLPAINKTIIVALNELSKNKTTKPLYATLLRKWVSNDLQYAHPKDFIAELDHIKTIAVDENLAESLITQQKTARSILANINDKMINIVANYTPQELVKGGFTPHRIEVLLNGNREIHEEAPDWIRNSRSLRTKVQGVQASLKQEKKEKKDDLYKELATIRTSDQSKPYSEQLLQFTEDWF